jgi:hypothetical protein
VFGAGATFKVADLAINTTSDVSEAAIEHRDKWLGAQLAFSGADAVRLKQIKAQGGDLNGDEATAIKARLRARVEEIQRPDHGLLGYTTAVVLDNLPYAVAEVGIDKLLEKTVGLTLDKIGVFALIDKFSPAPKVVNWALNNGGPLAAAEKRAGWRALSRLAREAGEAAEDQLHEQAASIVEKESEAVANYFAEDRVAQIKDSVADALARAYQKQMAEHPSAPRPAMMASARLEVARAVAAAPVAMIAPPPAPVQVVTAFPADPMVRILQADDQAWNRRSDAPRVVIHAAPPPATWSPAPPSAADQARWAQLHAEMARVGDGKTYTLCSNGCPATAESSWDGRRNQTLFNH